MCGSTPELDAKQRAADYLARHKLSITGELGGGFDGIVFSTNRDSAIKSFRFVPQYQVERNVYVRLQQHEIEELAGFHVPRLVQFDDRLRIVEMEIVQPPFVLDFATAYLDCRPPYDEDMWQEWHDRYRDIYEDRWDTVLSLLARLRRYGIHYVDPNPRNIVFE